MAPETARSAMPKTVGNYELVQKLAEGGMGAVYKGRHMQSGLIVAIKIVPPGPARNPVILRRFEQEFRAASSLDHPNIVKALDFCGTGPHPFLVMEFVDGVTLGHKVETEGPMSEAEAIHLMAQVCQGLHRAHKQNLIHRDVKPDNIMLTRDGVAKLTDLGLVKDIENELNLTRTGRGLGTPHFMAPEQFRNAKNADVRCDVYSLGATLYMLVTGQLPFNNHSALEAWMKKARNDYRPPREINPALSERLDWAVRRAMSGDPETRPSSCREFVEDLIGHSTRLAGPPSGVWFLVYSDEHGRQHTLKGSVEAVRKAVTSGQLGDPAGMRVCQSKLGPFTPLRELPEYRDLVIVPAAAPTPGTPARPPAAAKRLSDPDSVDFSDTPDGRSSTSARMRRPPSAMDATAHYPGLTPPSDAAGTLPHLDLGAPRRSSSGWVRELMMWLLVIGVAAASAGLGFLYLRNQ